MNPNEDKVYNLPWSSPARAKAMRFEKGTVNGDTWNLDGRIQMGDAKISVRGHR